jgi:hypothetical protein
VALDGWLDGQGRLRGRQRRHGVGLALQNNVLNRRHWRSREERLIAIITRIERTYTDADA